MRRSESFANQRVGIFVDAQNLYHSAKNLYRGRVNYAELIQHLVAGRQLIRAMAYVVKSEGVEPSKGSTLRRERRTRDEGIDDFEGPIDRTDRGLSSEASFFEALTKAGLELRMKDLQIFGDGLKKADWDVGMAVDAIRMSSFLDVVIIVTGDGDFIPLVDYLKWGAGRLVEVAAFKRSASAKIQEAADRFINIEEIPRAIIKR
ncbi:MAG: NYN domain-containing protein [Patescibacteria group bacterium]